MRTRGVSGTFFRKHAGIPGLSKANGAAVGAIGGGPRVISARIVASFPLNVLVTFNGTVAGTVATGVTYTVNGGAPQTFDRATNNGDGTVTYSTNEAQWAAGDVVRWIYAPGTITVDGEALPAQDVLVSNEMINDPAYVSGRIYDVDSVNQKVEITFNTRMTYTNQNGVTIKADGATKAITAIEGDQTSKLTFTTSGINHLHEVTWEYAEASGDLRNIQDVALADVLPQVVSNEIPTQTFWDPVSNEPTTFWDGNPPDETKWDKQ